MGLQHQGTGKVLISPGTTRLLRELAMKPQTGWEAARGTGLQCGRSAVQRDGLTRRQSGAERLRRWAAVGAAPNPYPNPPNPYPLALALAFPPVAFGDTRCPHAASRALLGYGFVGMSPETILGGRSGLRYGD